MENQTQSQSYCFSPDGKSEGWYFNDQIPEGWLRQNPDEGSHDSFNPPMSDEVQPETTTQDPPEAA